mmetsp:Transcript_51031/g.95548  ORF Transcript_51031/g.95548 Transcript_51031/m.95548 type:complete len:223 (+) Transcript_51031:67-735(+)
MFRRALAPALPRLAYLRAPVTLPWRVSVLSSSRYVSTPSLIELIKGNREMDVEAALPDADVKDIDQYGSTALILAAQRDWAPVVAELLQQPGVEPNHQNLFGSTALICAAANGHLATLEVLLADERVELEMRTRLGQTALFKAVLFGHMNTTERLLEAGAQSDVANKLGQTLRDVVKEHQLSTVTAFLDRRQHDARRHAQTAAACDPAQLGRLGRLGRAADG